MDATSYREMDRASLIAEYREADRRIRDEGPDALNNPYRATMTAIEGELTARGYTAEEIDGLLEEDQDLARA